MKRVSNTFPFVLLALPVGIPGISPFLSIDDDPGEGEPMSEKRKEEEILDAKIKKFLAVRKSFGNVNVSSLASVTREFFFRLLICSLAFSSSPHHPLARPFDGVNKSGNRSIGQKHVSILL